MFLSVEITVCGPINQKTGMVMNITELKQIIKDVIISKLDHKNLDKDVDFFKNNVSICSNEIKVSFLQYV